jgi:hypothetical protein
MKSELGQGGEAPQIASGGGAGDAGQAGESGAA